jgi:hypothetical protein
VSYHACFHDKAEGLQTHVYAPLGLDIQANWTVGGRLPGEPKPPAEPGLNTPRHGLYIREDVKMTCSSLLMGFVKRTFKDSHGQLVNKLVERAHILESNFANERLTALRNVDPSERMGHGDIFIAPPPDYQPSPGHSLLQVPSPRFITHSSHLRSHSDPVLSPGFSSSSTLNDQNDSPSKPVDRPMSLIFLHEEKTVSTSAPEQGSFLLPATTYDGSFSHQRQISLYPGSPLSQHPEYTDSVLPLSPRQQGEERSLPLQPPRISYTPHERPISFTFPFDPKSPFDRKSNSSTSSHLDQQNLLNDIDDAIDEFMYTLPSTTYKTLPAMTYEPLPATTYEPLSAKAYEPLPATTYKPLPATTYTPEPTLSNATYDPRHERKDSVMPAPTYSDKDLPPVPPKDEKYRKGSIRK